MSAVQTRDLLRSYRSRGGKNEIRALDGVTLDIEEGEIHGLLGPNGAGKTTLVKILSTVLVPTGGSATVLGYDVVRQTAAVSPLIGIVFGGDRGLYSNLTGCQILQYWAALYNVPVKQTASRVESLLERVGLRDRCDDITHTYSRGMKQRLHLARGLIGNARILFFDEPTIGMDPLAAWDFRQLVKDLRSEGRTILLTTHDMAEAEAVCDRVALIDHGRLLAVETPQTLAQLIAKHERIDFECGSLSVIDDLRQLPGVATVSSLPQAGAYRVDLHEGQVIKQVLELLVASGVTSVRTSGPTLDEVYVHVIGNRGLKV